MAETISHEAILAVLTSSKKEAKSIKDIARAMDLEIASYMDWIKVEQSLARSLRALNKWGWVACDKRRRKSVPRLWYNVYWMTELARSNKP